MSEWQPIDTYDKLEKKPRNAVFLFAEEVDERNNRIRLSQCLYLVRRIGCRLCTHWIKLPDMKEKNDT